MPKRTPEQVWDTVHADAVDAEMDRVAKLSDEEVDRELADAGFDPAAVAADAAALRSRLAKAEAAVAQEREAVASDLLPGSGQASRDARAVASLVDRRRGIVRTVALLAAVFAFVLVPLILLPWLWGPRREVARPTPPEETASSTAIASATPSLRDEAEAFRRSAANECAAGRWVDCMMSLDRAREMDPAGEATHEVQALRNAARDGIRQMQEKRDLKPPLDLKPPRDDRQR
jgi:hypothetical protein